jgi:hypothetical protein
MMIPIYSYISSNDSNLFSYIPDLPSCKRFHIFWLVVLTPLKNDGVKVSWDDDIYMESHKFHAPNHQPVSL